MADGARPGAGSPHTERDAEEGLARIRFRRRVFLVVLFSLPPVVFLTMAWVEGSGSWLPLAIPFALLFFGMFSQHRLHRCRCPRCGGFFFAQTVTKDNYTPESSISFPPQKRCRNCGLRLYE